MKNQIINLANSAITEVSMLMIVLCLVLISLSAKIGGLPVLEVGAGLAAGVILIGWLVWATYKLASRKPVVALEARPRVIIDSCTSFLMLCWLALSSFPLAALIWAPFFIYNLYRCVKVVR